MFSTMAKKIQAKINSSNKFLTDFYDKLPSSWYLQAFLKKKTDFFIKLTIPLVKIVFQ